MQNLPFQFQFQAIQNYQNALQKTYFSGINNGAKTLNGVALINDSLLLSQYPDIVDELCNSRAFIRKVCTHKIDKAYQKPAILQFTDKVLSDEETTYLQDRFHNLIKIPSNPRSYFGRLSPLQSIKEALYLSEKHGGSLLLISYEGEGDFSIPLGIQNEVDTKRTMYFTPVSISGNNTYIAKQFFQALSNYDFDGANKTLEEMATQKPFQVSYPTENEYVSLQLQIGSPHVRIHTSRLLPILSCYKNYSIRNNWYQAWDNSILQGAMKSLINYYLFIDILPEMIREKVMNKVILDEDLRHLTEGAKDSLLNGIKSFGEKTGVSTYAILPKGSTIQRDELSLGGIREIHDALQDQIIMDTDSIKADLIGEGSGGIGNGNEEHMVRIAHEKLARIHEKYDWVYQYVFSRLLFNKFSGLLKGVKLSDVQITFDNTPTETAKEKRDFQVQLLDRSIQMLQAGIIDAENAKNIINDLQIPEFQIKTQAEL